MASFILRPSADISVEHEKRYTNENGGTGLSTLAGYLMISEEVSDEDSTYLRLSVDADSGNSVTESVTSKFALSGVVSSAPFKVSRITMYTSCSGSGSLICTIACGDSDFSFASAATLNGLYYVSSSESTEDEVFLDAINTHIRNEGSFPSLTLSLKSTVTDAPDEKGTSSGQDISQVYLEIEYTEITGLNIHHKSNGAWAQAQNVYQKQSGAWVEITENECINILQNNLIRKQ